MFYLDLLAEFLSRRPWRKPLKTLHPFGYAKNNFADAERELSIRAAEDF
jgi:hypothetical protein